MQVTVIIPTVDRPEILRDCLQGALSQLRAGDEVIVVAQGTSSQRQATAAMVAAVGSGPGAVEEANGEGPVVRVAEEPEPNLPAARNRGLREASTQVAVFLDDDAVPLPGWLDGLLRAFGEGADLIAGRLVEEPDLTTNSHRRPGAWLTCTGHTRRNYNTSEPGVSGLAPGGNMAVRRELALAAGGFDEALGSGSAVYEDTEFAERLRHRGAAVRYVPEAAVEHRAVRTGGCWQVPGGGREIDRARNMSTLFRRHRLLSWPIMAGAYIGAAKWKLLRGHLEWRTLTGILRALGEGWRAGRRQPVPLVPVPRPGEQGVTGGDEREPAGGGSSGEEGMERDGQE
jgi:GT2 family glycosyltransferase